ncbi:adenosylcobinamide amidohydrolase [candidate division KSB3 bacterium]|uniref:Adenosylcobinamide amidohydrolase n=1 Tax=candidate division KSB3 bacterium TaxID=2044937 RepID=A0A2G6KHY5_9BACT|nr:MAG: adenosylcobinamide amidohydrolase [candidate division KSB3 bacterium]
MLLNTYYNGIEIHRREKIILAKFLAPHRVLSTCRAVGGMQEGLEYVYNHQSCEPIGHTVGLPESMLYDPQEYRRLICGIHKIPAEKAATMGTAANMRNAAIVSETFRELEVVSICTGGVETNGGRVGDPASVYEHEKGFEKLGREEPNPEHGTINTMVFINKELTPGSMVRVVVTATEAKTAVLQELAVNSRYSDGLATGTGTDQILVASMCETGVALTSAGKHSKLGELIGKSVFRAVKRTLAMQNGLTPERQRSSLIHLERFGATEETMIAEISRYLMPETQRLFRKNFIGVDRDSVVVAAVAACVHLRDKIVWGILPESCWSEILSSHAAQIAAAVSGKYDHLPNYRARLAPLQGTTTNAAFLELIYHALALGFREKWDIYDRAP